MRIPCPNCAAEYDVPPARLSARRIVRCSRCNNQWEFIQEAEAPPPPADTDAFGSLSDLPPAPAVSAADRLAVPPGRASRSMALTAAWVASVAVLAGGVSATVAWRADIARAWPPSARLLGTPPDAPARTTAAASPKPDPARPDPARPDPARPDPARKDAPAPKPDAPRPAAPGASPGASPVASPGAGAKTDK